MVICDLAGLGQGRKSPSSKYMNLIYITTESNGFHLKAVFDVISFLYLLISGIGLHSTLTPRPF